jgi:hypothetical protein
MDRMTAIRCASFAVYGSVSEKWIPGTEVGIEPNVPLISRGAPGLGSKVSCWGGPPLMKIRMQAFALPKLPATERDAG